MYPQVSLQLVAGTAAAVGLAAQEADPELHACLLYACSKEQAKSGARAVGTLRRRLKQVRYTPVLDLDLGAGPPVQAYSEQNYGVHFCSTQ
jgi:hypothetical protein